MHAEAFKFVSRYATNDRIDVIEIGSRDVNGTVRSLFPSAKWTGLDLYEGPCVDWVGDATQYQPRNPVDLVVCCEVLEHAEQWRQLIQVAAAWIKPGGRMIVTCAGPGRNTHSAIDGGNLRAGEYYQNVTVGELCMAASWAGLQIEYAERLGTDTRMLASKPM